VAVKHGGIAGEEKLLERLQLVCLGLKLLMVVAQCIVVHSGHSDILVVLAVIDYL
jgi:hypothetical protein